MRFKLDENIGDTGRGLLTHAGHDVSTVALQSMNGASDVALYNVCCVENRILITLDRDFGEVLRFPPENIAGIVVLDCRGRLSPTSIQARLKEFLTLLASQRIDRQLWIVEPGRVRIHERRDQDSSKA